MDYYNLIYLSLTFHEVTFPYSRKHVMDSLTCFPARCFLSCVQGSTSFQEEVSRCSNQK